MSTLIADPLFAFDAIRAPMEQHLGLTSPDPNSAAWYNWALGEGSRWLGHDWTDDDGADIPKTDEEILGLQTALFQGVRTLRESFEKAQGVSKLRTAAVEEQYADILIGASLARQVLASWLYHFRLKVYLL